MSEVKVNKISPRSGTTVTLGDSGDTIAINSGASLTGFTSTGIDDNATSTAITILSSGFVGVGQTNPTTNFHVGDDSAGNENTSIRIEGGSTSGYSQVHFADSGDVNVGRVQYTHSSNTMALYTNDTEVMRIDSSGNVGIGVVPQTWYTQIDALQFGLGGSVSGNTANPSRTYLSANAYFNASNQETYIATDEASQYFQNAGTHIFKVASSGTAGTAISFTEAMKIDNSGNVLVGKSTDAFADEGVVLATTQSNAFTRNNANVMSVRRNTSDGDIVSYYKDTTKVGSIGSFSSLPYVAGSSKGVLIGSDNLVPSTNTGAISTNAMDLGASNRVWRDVYVGNRISRWYR